MEREITNCATISEVPFLVGGLYLQDIRDKLGAVNIIDLIHNDSAVVSDDFLRIGEEIRLIGIEVNLAAGPQNTPVKTDEIGRS